MDTDLKHTTKLVSKWLEDNEWLEWPSQRPDLIDLWAVYKPEPVTPVLKIPANYCENLVEGSPESLSQVIQVKGNSTTS